MHWTLPMTNSKRISVADHLIDEREWNDSIKEVCQKHLEAAAISGAALENELTRPRHRSFRWEHKDVNVPPNVLAAIADFLKSLFTLSFWGTLSNSVKDSISKILFNGIVDGKSVQEVAAELKDLLGPDGAATKAILIARTECLSN